MRQRWGGSARTKSPLIETIRASVIGDHEVMELPEAGKDHEYLTATSEAVIYLAMIWLLLRRLTRS